MDSCVWTRDLLLVTYAHGDTECQHPWKKIYVALKAIIQLNVSIIRILFITLLMLMCNLFAVVDSCSLSGIDRILAQLYYKVQDTFSRHVYIYVFF